MSGHDTVWVVVQSADCDNAECDSWSAGYWVIEVFASEQTARQFVDARPNEGMSVQRMRVHTSLKTARGY